MFARCNIGVSIYDFKPNHLFTIQNVLSSPSFARCTCICVCMYVCAQLVSFPGTESIHLWSNYSNDVKTTLHTGRGCIVSGVFVQMFNVPAIVTHP